jgi:hypothetical protein
MWQPPTRAWITAQLALILTEIRTMSTTISTDIANLGSAVATLTATVAAETAAITTEGSAVTSAITSLQGIVSGDALTAADQATLEGAIATLGTVNTNLLASTAAITNQGSTLAAALPVVTPAA